MKFEATQFGSLAQRPEREDRYRALNTPVPHSPCALHPETWHVLGLCSSHTATLQQQLPWGLCSLPQAPAPPGPPQHGQAGSWSHSLVPHSLDGFGSALIIVLLHVPVHGAQLHLPSEVDVHRALLHRGINELIGGVAQLKGKGRASISSVLHQPNQLTPRAVFLDFPSPSGTCFSENTLISSVELKVPWGSGCCRAQDAVELGML